MKGSMDGMQVYYGAMDLDRSTGHTMLEHFRCPPEFIKIELNRDPRLDAGYFRVGDKPIGYGACSTGTRRLVSDALPDALAEMTASSSTVCLPFDPDEVVDNLRYERYASSARSLGGDSFIRRMYYVVRPLMPVGIRKHFQKRYLRGWDKLEFPRWPVDHTVESIFEKLMVLTMQANGIDRIPFVWFWPDGARSSVILTHDVETQAGLEFCSNLMDLNDSFGFRSSFQIVPEKRYPVNPAVLEEIRARGFEVNVHDLNHDGQLFSNREEFVRRARRISHYRREFAAEGFRAAVMYRNPDWYQDLDFSYDMSIPNVAHLDPQRGGCCTVFPFFIGNLVELPLTTVQDYPLFHILNDYSIGLWKKQIAIISERNGLISFIIHPDYVIDGACRRVYKELLQYLATLRDCGQVWAALPKEVASWWRLRSQMTIVKEFGSWRVQGEGSERARLAFAVLDHGTIRYEL